MVSDDRIRVAGEHLVSLMDALIEGHQALVPLIKAQRQALVQNRIADLAAANEELDAALAELERLETDRQALASKIHRLGEIEGRSAGVSLRVSPWAPEAEWDQPAVKLEDLMEFLPPVLGAELQGRKKRLTGELLRLKSELGVNTALAENGTRVVHATLGILTSVVGRTGPDRHQIYGSKGKAQYARTQIRSLMNRRA